MRAEGCRQVAGRPCERWLEERQLSCRFKYPRKEADGSAYRPDIRVQMTGSRDMPASAIAVRRLGRGWVDVELSVPTSAISYRAALSGLSIRRRMQGICRKSLPPRNKSRRRKPSSRLRFPLSPFPTHFASRCPPCRRPSADSPSAASADFHLVHRGVPT